MPHHITAETASIAAALATIAEHARLPDDHALRQQATQLTLLHHDATLATYSLPQHPAALVQQLARQATPALPSLCADWQFDTTGRQLVRSDVSVLLTEKEAQLLTALLQHYPDAASREHLLRDVWDMQPEIETHTLETHIYRLRHKLDTLTPRPCDILTLDSAYQLTLEQA